MTFTFTLHLHDITFITSHGPVCNGFTTNCCTQYSTFNILYFTFYIQYFICYYQLLHTYVFYIQYFIFHYQLREAPTKTKAVGHCPNSDCTPPALKWALWGTFFPGRFEQICQITVLTVHKCTKHSGKP